MPLNREFLLSRGRCCGNGCVNCPYEESIVDRRFLASGEFVPRDYQQESIEAFWRGTKTHKGQNPLIVLPTGGGKTIVIADILRGISKIGYRSIVLARSKELVKQNLEKFSMHLPDVSAGIYCAGLGRKETSPNIIFGTIQSCCTKGEEFGERQLIIVDEAHEIPQRDESQYQIFLNDICKTSPNALLLGLTASPYRLDGGLIYGPSRQFDYVAHAVPLRKLIDDKYLTKPATLVADQVDMSGVKKTAGDFNKSQVEGKFLEAGTVVTDQIVSASDEKQTKSVLIFASGVAHAESIRARIADKGHSVGLVTGETLPLIRSTLIDNFNRGTLRFLVNVDVLTTGFDCTRIDHIAVCRATESPGLFYQICGRGFRLHKGKDVCWIQDFGGNIERHGPIDSPSYGINTIKVKTETGEAPQKACPSCFEILPASATVCEKCGFEFPRQPNVDTRASRQAILKTPRWHNVESVSYQLWKGKGGKPDTLRVDYSVSLDGDWLERKVVSEWVCILHDGFARSMAMRWWIKRTSLPFPMKIEDAIDLAERGALRTPRRVEIVKDGAYDRIEDYDLEDSAAETMDFSADPDEMPF